MSLFNAYESRRSVPPQSRLGVHYFENRLGPQVLIQCCWGQHLTTHGDIGQAVIIPREEWDRMLEAARRERDGG